jgi:phage terminase Nu1 subunit (DNA packaging protein)
MTHKRNRRSIEALLGDPTPAKRGAGRPVADHRQKLVLAQAEQVELKNAKLRGELLDAKEVEARWTSAVLDVRAAVLAVASRYGARFGVPATQLAALDSDLRDALAGLAGGEAPHAG